MKDNMVRTRFAPSPTGFLHIGGLRTALYAYLFAMQNDGKMILRIEDTDQARSVDGALENLVTWLTWAGITSHEGAMLDEDHNIVYKGDYGPYKQSERKILYREHVDLLVKKEKAYYCFCTSERLDVMRKQQQANKQPPMYDRTCLTLEAKDVSERIKNGEPHVVRLLVPRDRVITFHDSVRARVEVKGETIDDQVLLKSDGFPTYHLANVVDDYLMKITHVIRGEEWLPSTPKHILLYEAFEWGIPEFAHLPLLLNPDKTKLSKRQGDVSVEDYVTKGYLQGTIVNFVALLGWNPGGGSTEEIFTMEELIKKFDLAKVHKAGAVVDTKKLDWMNGHYIKKTPVDDLYDVALPFLEKKDFYNTQKHGEDFIKKFLTVEQERLERLDNVGEDNQFFFDDIDANKELLRWKENTDEQTTEALQKAEGILKEISENDWTRKNLEKILMDAAGDKRGDFLWPLRAALTGAQHSPSPFDCAWVLGKEISLERIKNALNIFV